jgi:SagB-type dehydrogenase family enzyme
MRPPVWLLFASAGFLALAGCLAAAGEDGGRVGEALSLPGPRADSPVCLERALALRRSVRSFDATELSTGELSQLLWAAQGVTHGRGRRTAPSAGALYPIELLVVAGRVRQLPAGVYRYQPDGHRLLRLAAGDRRARLTDAAVCQTWVGAGAAVLAVVAVPEGTTRKYGERGVRFAHLEAGHVSQNVCLQAVALGLGTVPVGSFDDGAVAELLGLGDGQQPLLLLPVGRPREAP